MNRREFMWTAAAVSAAYRAPQTALIVPVRRVKDGRAKYAPGQFQRFSCAIWPEAVRDFERCGIRLEGGQSAGEIRLTAADRPVFTGLEHGAINMVLTDHVPMYWDNARALAGMTTAYEGYHLCVIALRYAHGHQIPYLSVNTCVHELLHALLQDVFVNRPKWYQVDGREWRIDWYATRMWLFHDGAAVQQSARAYLERLRSGVAAQT